MVLRLPTPSLVVLVGVSASGKSTWAQQTFNANEIVSSDRLRGMVGAGEDDQRAGTVAFELLDRIVEARLGRGLTTVVDTLGFDRDERRRWVGWAHNASLPAVAVRFDIPLSEAHARNEQRDRPIPKTVLARQHRRMKVLGEELPDDGFDQIHVSQQAAAVVAKLAVTTPDPDESGSPSAHTFGLMISRFDWGIAPGELPSRLSSIAIRAEAAGFRDLWLMDHLRQIPQVGRPWEDIPEVWTSLAYLAGVTTTIRLGALVSPITHHHPLVLGKAAATLDVMSGGRANLGLGIGWDRQEHAAYGIDFPDADRRYLMLEDALQALPLLWGKGSPEFEGQTLTAAGMACYPRPIQDTIPITVGGSGERRTLRLVARYADACNLFGSPETVAKKVQILHRHCHQCDRRPSEIEVTHLVNALTANDRRSLFDRIERLRPRAMTPDEYAVRHNGATVGDQIRHFDSYRRAGANHSIVVLPDIHLEGSIEGFAQVIENLDRP